MSLLHGDAHVAEGSDRQRMSAHGKLGCALTCTLLFGAGLLAEPTCALAGGGRTAVNDTGRANQRPPLPAEIATIQRNVIYGSVGKVKLKLDLYRPKRPTDKPRPVAVYLHGGAWTRGAKSFGTGMFPFGELLQRGYLIAAVNYRLAPHWKFPAQIEDVKCAIRYLRAHATELELNPDGIGVFGGSAGGHLAALLGTADASAGFDSSGGWTNQSSRLQAVVDMFGPADLTPDGGLRNERIGRRVYGAKSAEDPVLRQASPITYVSPDDPPFLVFHGAKDRVVPLKQSERLVAALAAAGAPATLVVVTNAGHSFAPAGGWPKPDHRALSRMIADFFDRHLRPELPRR